MDEVRIVKKRTIVWPIVAAVVLLALVIAFVMFRNSGATQDIGWNGVMDWSASAEA
jgi:hypothetical protein